MKQLANITAFENLQNQTSETVLNKTFVEKDRIGQPDREKYGPISDLNLNDTEDLNSLFQILYQYNLLVKQGVMSKQEALRQISEAYGLGIPEIKLLDRVKRRNKQREM